MLQVYSTINSSIEIKDNEERSVTLMQTDTDDDHDHTQANTRKFNANSDSL